MIRSLLRRIEVLQEFEAAQQLGRERPPRDALREGPRPSSWEAVSRLDKRRYRVRRLARIKAHERAAREAQRAALAALGWGQP